MGTPRPGPVVLFGSGETSKSGGKVFDDIARRIDDDLRIAILETPAGFQPNSASVADQIADFLKQRLQNYAPTIDVVPARKRNTEFSPDNAALLAPLLDATLVFLGPGSPTYAARQLQDSRAWHVLQARHRLGAAIVFASAATIAAGAHVLPVYEIFKAGDDLHWRTGLDFFGPYGLSLIFIPHWNNNEGGDDFDSSRCYMGADRFARLLALLRPDLSIVGIDEHTALIIDPDAGTCEVMGIGGVRVITPDETSSFQSEASFSIDRLGAFRRPTPATGIPDAVWKNAAAVEGRESQNLVPSDEVLDLVEARNSARNREDWISADALREQIAQLGWQVHDTPEGTRVEPL